MIASERPSVTLLVHPAPSLLHPPSLDDGRQLAKRTKTRAIKRSVGRGNAAGTSLIGMRHALSGRSPMTPRGYAPRAYIRT
jgi:hypothetical protein